MSVNNTKKDVKISDYLYVLYKWRKILIINILIAIVLSTILSFLIPKTYKATSSLILPSDNSMGMGGLSSLFSDNSALSLGAKLFGVSSTNEDLILGLFNTRVVLEDVIKKYGLADYYGYDNDELDKTIKAFKGDLIFEPNEYGMIEVSGN